MFLITIVNTKAGKWSRYVTNFFSKWMRSQSLNQLHWSIVIDVVKIDNNTKQIGLKVHVVYLRYFFYPKCQHFRQKYLYLLIQEDSVKMDALKQQEAISPCLVDENGETRSQRMAFAHNDLSHRKRSSVALPKCLPKSAVYSPNCKFSLSHMIDRVCRIFFPVSFGFMNILYWYLLTMK